MNLIELGRGVFCLTATERGYGYTNVGLLIDADGLTVVDTGPCPAFGHTARREILDLTRQLELPIKRVVLTSSRAPFAGGGWAFWQAGFYGTEATSDDLDAPVVWVLGATADFVSGKVPRGPAVLHRHGLEWLARLLVEPRRLWRRYLVGNARFAARVADARWRRRGE